MEITLSVSIIYFYVCCIAGTSHFIYDHEDYDAPDGNMIPMGSIMVKPGCTLYNFKDHEYDGERWVIAY